MFAKETMNPYEKQIDLILKINQLDNNKKLQLATVVDTLYMVQMNENEGNKYE